MVYPVRDGYYIELDGEAFYASDCAPLLQIPDAIRPGQAEALRYRWTQVGTKLRVCFDGSEALLAATIALHAQLNLTITGFGRWAPNLGSQKDQNVVSPDADCFDWFVDFGGPRLPSQTEIDNLLHGASRHMGEFALPDADPLMLRTQIAARDERVALLEDLLTQQDELSNAEAARLIVQVNLMQAALSRYRDLADDAEISKRALAKSLERLAEEKRQTQPQLAEAPVADTSDLEIVLENWQQSEIALSNARTELAATSEELEQLKREVSAVRRVEVPGTSDGARLSAGRKKVRERDIEATFSSLLPNLIPIGESIPFLAEQVINPRPLLLLLKKINDTSKDDLPSKKVRGAGGWFECHFSTGQADDGRLYFSWGQGTSNKGHRVLISSKRRQPQDLQRLSAP